MSKINRQEFLKILKPILAISGVAVIAAPIIAFFYPANLKEMPSEPVKVGPEDELPVNTSKTVSFGRYPALIINTSEGLRAFSAVCTHFACIVKFNPHLGQIACPCHEGYFDQFDGSVISGPPPAPLESLKVNIVNGDIYVGGEA